MTPDLAERVRSHKAKLMSILVGTASTPERPDPAAESPQDGRDAPRRPKARRDSAAWPTIPSTMPMGIAELAAARPGWTAASWRTRLRQLGDACESVNQARACELREAARLVDGHGIRQV